MKTDTLFYELFQEFPEFFFELIGQTPDEARYYRFTATEIKQTAFRLDGLFVPTLPNKPLYILEVQFQNDPQFYGRLFAEMFLYFYRQGWKGTWRTVVLFPRRSFEPEEIEPYRMLLESPLVHRVYLEELEQSSTVGIGIIRLVVAKEKEAPEQARQLIVQARSQYPEALTQRGVLELIEMVMVYKFSKLSRQEIEAMLKLDGLKETKVYQEALEEGKQEGKTEGKLEGKLEAVPALVARGFGVEEIADILRLTIEQVRSALP